MNHLSEQQFAVECLFDVVVIFWKGISLTNGLFDRGSASPSICGTVCGWSDGCGFDTLETLDTGGGLTWAPRKRREWMDQSGSMVSVRAC